LPNLRLRTCAGKSRTVPKRAGKSRTVPKLAQWLDTIVPELGFYGDENNGIMCTEGFIC
jgi:hypothetical protein